MRRRLAERYRNRPFLVEVFVVFNLAFLVLDVLIAHASNDFHHGGEWIPVAFSVLGSAALAATLFRREPPEVGRTRSIGLVVGWGAIAVGVGGLFLHLESQFFAEATLRNLVYSAPFAAPLAYAGLGFLLLLNRLVPHQGTAWGQWVLFFAWGGFVGNFVLSLADHAQNGFFFWQEWIAVAASALAVGFLGVAVLHPGPRSFLRACFWIVALQVATGVLGFVFHLVGTLPAAQSGLLYTFIYGAPVFAPLLFADLALLAAIGLWDLYARAVVAGEAAAEPVMPPAPPAVPGR